MSGKRISKLAKAMQEDEANTPVISQTTEEQTNILAETILEHKKTSLFDNGSTTTNNENDINSNNSNGNTISDSGNNSIIDEKKADATPKKRGRPTKEETVRKALNNTELQNGKTENKNDFFSEYRQSPNTSTNGSPISAGGAQSEVIKNYFTGLLVLTLIDAIAPAGITFLLKKNDPSKKINQKDFKLTDDEMKSLEPLADEVIKLYIGTLDPLSAFVISVIIIYGAKITPHLI